MNCMVSTYNDTLSHCLQLPPQCSLLRQRWQRLLKTLPKVRSGWRKYGSGFAKNTLSGNCCSADCLKTRASDCKLLMLLQSITTTTTTVLRPFVRDNPCELVPEENIHPLTYPSTMLHSVLPVQFTCLITFPQNCSPSYKLPMFLIYYAPKHLSNFTNYLVPHHLWSAHRLNNTVTPSQFFTSHSHLPETWPTVS